MGGGGGKQLVPFSPLGVSASVNINVEAPELGSTWARGVASYARSP